MKREITYIFCFKSCLGATSDDRLTHLAPVAVESTLVKDNLVTDVAQVRQHESGIQYQKVRRWECPPPSNLLTNVCIVQRANKQIIAYSSLML